MPPKKKIKNKFPLIVFVIGTRPEAIKMAPVIKKFQECSSISINVVLTGQHKDMVPKINKIFDIKADYDFDIMKKSQSLTDITCKTLSNFSEFFKSKKPDLLLVQGDTTTAFAASLAAFYEKIPLGHIEAGLRTENVYDPFPEEVNRRLISQLAALNFAPSIRSFNYLKKENIKGQIHLTGNTVIDSLKIILKKKLSSKILDSKNQQKSILVTVHRRENWGIKLESIALGIKKVCEKRNDISFLLPMHPNYIVRDKLKTILGNVPQVNLVEPMDYQDMIAAMRDCFFILTDSGGLQEEAPSLGKPVLILRETTERHEVIEAGVAKLIGTDESNIYEECIRLISDDQVYKRMSRKLDVFGDGQSSERILSHCLKFLNIP